MMVEEYEEDEWSDVRPHNRALLEQRNPHLPGGEGLKITLLIQH